MALKQPNSANHWPEPAGSSAPRTLTPMTWQLVGSELQITPNGSIDARMLASGSEFRMNDGGDNPSSLAELRMVDTGTEITFYE